MNRGQLVDRLRKLQPALRSAGIRHLALFGSRARGDNAASSDIDLLIDIEDGRTFSLVHLVGAENRIHEALDLPVSIVVRRNLSRAFIDSIQDDVIEIY